MFTPIKYSLLTTLSLLIITKISPGSLYNYAGKTSASFTLADSHPTYGSAVHLLEIPSIHTEHAISFIIMKDCFPFKAAQLVGLIFPEMSPVKF